MTLKRASNSLSFYLPLMKAGQIRIMKTFSRKMKLNNIGNMKHFQAICKKSKMLSKMGKA